jgi:hypothetical protein
MRRQHVMSGSFQKLPQQQDRNTTQHTSILKRVVGQAATRKSRDNMQVQ